MNRIEEIAQQLKNGREWLLMGHMIPDGDCIGSLLGLALGLQGLGLRVQVLMPDPLPASYHHLQGISMFKRLDQIDQSFSGLVYLDCSDLGRLSEEVINWLQGLPSCLSVNIDHHATNDLFCQYNYVDTTAAATGEIIADLLSLMEAPLSPAIAQALYVALLMDTGGFLNANTTSRTMRTAAWLIDQGADVNLARINLFESKSREEVYLTRAGLTHLDFASGGRIALMLLPYNEIEAIGAGDMHPEGLINYTRTIKGVEVGVLLREISPGVVKIGFRSRGAVDVAALATAFGGGGHPQAAGARMNASLDEVKKLVISKIEEVI